MRKDYHFYLDECKDKDLKDFINNTDLWKDCGSRSAFIRKLLYMAKESLAGGIVVHERNEIKKDDTNFENENLFSSLMNMMNQ